MKKAVTRKAAPKKVVSKKSAAKKIVRTSPKAKSTKPRRSSAARNAEPEGFTYETPRARSSVQSGDLQGLSGGEGANAESVEELLEEGNALEANAVLGVEHADDADESEVHTHEVLEDDVPEEYLDRDE